MKKTKTTPSIQQGLKTKMILILFLACTSGGLFSQPAIINFKPKTGPVGSLVAIQGVNFSSDPDQNIVYFGAVRAKVVKANDTMLIVRAPAGSSYQPISVTVKTLTAFSSQPFIVTFPGNRTISTSSFSKTASLTSGAYPFCVCSGDINGDGKPDLISTNFSDNTVSIFKNQSNKLLLSYAPKIDIATSEHPEFTCLGDVDGDGKLDIIVASDISQVISVYKNISTIANISFMPKIDFVAGVYPISVSVADLNNDGKPDIIFTNNHDNNVSVLKNKSDSNAISFAPKKDFATGSSPGGIAINDFNGDGKSDIATANYFSNTVSVLKNTTVSVNNITFAPKVDFAVGTSPENISTGDLDSDGKPDLAVNNSFSNDISVLRNASINNTISFETKIDFQMASNTSCVSIGDLNGDAKPELAVSGSDLSVSVLQNACTKGNISFLPGVSFYNGGSSSFIISEDQNADGKAELIVASFTSVFVFQNFMGSLPFYKTNNEGIANDNMNRQGYSNDASRIFIYPNPFADYIIIHYPKENDNNYIKITDMTGIIRKKFLIPAGTLQIKLDLKELSGGTYTVSWYDGNTAYSKKIIKQ